ncbi:hypothetical protein HWV62_39611 [Athelia sp. TMB]|nr:hypothetical protein HWV62_39611 [Athelia sp. TMB]
MFCPSLSKWRASLPLLVLLAPAARALTVYNYEGAVPTTTPGVTPAYTGYVAFDPMTLAPPALPTARPANTFNIALNAAPPAGLSIKQNGSFFGFSIEFSLLNQVLGGNSSVLQVPFLNLMANIRDRCGAVHIRVGGNTQEFATMVDSLPDGAIISKEASDVNNPTKTPTLTFTEDVIYMMGNVSSLVNVKWFIGVPFNDTTNWRLEIVESAERILGDYLVGVQAGNEPDLYAKHGHRPDDYSPADYGDDFGLLVKAIAADPLITKPNNLIAPSLSGSWTPESVWNTGFATTYRDNLYGLAMERYPTDNCYARYGPTDANATYHDPNQKFPTYMTHTAALNLLSTYTNSTAYAQTLGLPFLMFETNSASCGGFTGISDAFAASLWALDYGLQLAYSNFSVAMFHTSGQNVSYNPFTPPPSSQSFYHQWTVSPVYYAALVAAEFFGMSNVTQVLDVFGTNQEMLYTPAYAAYENGNFVRLAMFNYLDDPSGNSDYTATISVGGSNMGEPAVTPASVQVKYLLAPSVSSKTNITWANQTFGDYYESDGRLMGDENIITVPCDTNTNTCQIKVPAPGFALVFFTDAALSESDYNGQAQQTFATTVQTRTINTVTVAPGTLATSNGGKDRASYKGSTSPGSDKNAAMRMVPGAVAIVAAALGALLIGRAM